MSTVIAQRDLRNNNAAIIAAVATGESFIVTKNGTPVAELHPVTHPRRRFVPRAELAPVAGQGPHIDAHRFRDDLDALLDQDL